MSEPVQLVPARTDHDIAEELKEKVKVAYSGLLPALDEAAARGFLVQAGVQMGPFGKFELVPIKIMKVY